MADADEERLLREVGRQNSESIFLARQRADRELLLAKEALEARTSELDASLAMIQATLESTADGILVTDQSNHITGYNHQFAQMWHIPQHMLTSHVDFALDVMSAQMPDPAAYLRDVRTILAAPIVDDFELLELADGRVFERCGRVQRIGNRVAGRVWSFRDVTHRHRSEEALRKAKDAADAANRAKSAFLATMSHELRTPLNAIAGYAQLIELGIHGPITAAQRSAIERIQASQRHLLGLIDEVLIHAKLEAGRVGFNLVCISMENAIDDAAAILSPLAGSKKVVLDVVPCEPHAVVRADKDRLHQILTNLLSNAIKFTDPGGHVSIRCVMASDVVRIDVRDTGIGIPADKIDEIFEPFVQVHSDLKRSAEGTGLGLAISRSLARAMGGDVEVESSLGEGSVFTVRLPAVTDD